jgi:type IV secretory pathway VirB6-like protein
MINPIGTFLVRTDAALTGSMTGVISYMTTSMATPVTILAIIYYSVQGFRFAYGDPEPLDKFVPNVIRVGTVIWLSSNLSAFNQWVTNIFFTGRPNALAAAIGNGTGTPSSLTGTAAAFDNLWSQIWVMTGTLLGQVTYSINGAAMLGGAILVVIFGSICLAVLVLVYECARFLLSVLICLAPALIACAMFDVTRPFFERAVGTVVSLILTQIVGLVVMQLVLMSDQSFMAQAVTGTFNVAAAQAQGATGLQAQGEMLQILCGLLMWFFAGAVAMWNVPVLAYSIGGGIMMRGFPVLRAWNALRSRGGPPPPPPGGGNPTPPPPNIEMPSPAALPPPTSQPPPPPPPPLHLSNRG